VIDLIGLAVLAVFVVIGAIRGTLAIALRIASLVLAYAAAFLAAPHVGSLLAERFQLPNLPSVALGGAIAFILAYVLFGTVSSVIRAIARRRRGLRCRSAGDRLGGAILGAAQGAVILLLLGMLVSFLEALRVSGAAGALVELPEVGPSKLVSVSQLILAKGAEATLGESGPAQRMTTRLLAHPAETVERFHRVVRNPRIEALQKDKLFWSHVEHGAVDQALNRASFLGIAHDGTLREDLADLGMVSDVAKVDPQLFRNSANDVLKEVGPRIRRLKNDPAFQGLAEDPEIQAALASGDPMQLLQQPRFRALLNGVLDGS
jgi:uncharacterized membrane protein required for colicin V production